MHTLNGMMHKLVINLITRISLDVHQTLSPIFFFQREPPFSLYLLDGSRISQVSLRTGKTRKKFPSLLQLQSHIALTSTSPDGAYLGGLTINGDFFLWNKATEVLETFVSPLSRLGGEKDKPSVQQFKGTKFTIIMDTQYSI